MRMTPKINKSAHYLGRMCKQASGTKDDKDTGGHQTRSSNSLKCVFTSEVCLPHPGNSTGPDHGHLLKISWSKELHSLLFYFLINLPKVASLISSKVSLSPSITIALKTPNSEHTCKVRDMWICPVRLPEGWYITDDVGPKTYLRIHSHFIN